MTVEGKVDKVLLDRALVRDAEENSERLLAAVNKIRAYVNRSMRLQWSSKFAHSRDLRYMVAMASEFRKGQATTGGSQPTFHKYRGPRIPPHVCSSKALCGTEWVALEV